MPLGGPVLSRVPRPSLAGYTAPRLRGTGFWLGFRAKGQSLSEGNARGRYLKEL
jgi:hypothetical protein